MSTSVSTPRIRLTQAMYALMVLTAALSDGRALAGDAALLAQAAGFTLVACGTLWRLWSSVFVAGRKDVEVVMEGPYARCRHPLYLGSLVAGLGLGLTTRSVVLATAVTAVTAVALLRAIAREEKWLAARHGQVWRDYCSRVPALLPKIRRPGLPVFREVNLPVFRKAFLDAGSVLGLWLLLVLIDALRPHGWWPVLFALP